MSGYSNCDVITSFSTAIPLDYSIILSDVSCDVITVVDSLIIDDDSPTLLITGCCLLLACRSQMAHPLHQDPQPSEAARRRKRLAQQAVQGKRFSFQYDRPLLPLMEVLMRSKRVFFFFKVAERCCPTLSGPVCPACDIGREDKLPLFTAFAATSSLITLLGPAPPSLLLALITFPSSACRRPFHLINVFWVSRTFSRTHFPRRLNTLRAGVSLLSF